MKELNSVGIRQHQFKQSVKVKNDQYFFVIHKEQEKKSGNLYMSLFNMERVGDIHMARIRREYNVD